MFALKRKLKKIYQIGPKECWRIVANRAMVRQFALRYKKYALQKKATHNWQKIQQRYTIYFDLFLHRAKRRSLLFLSDHFDNIDQIISQADDITHNKWLLFNQPIDVSGSNKWHSDFLLKNQKGVDYTFDNKLYYDDICLSVGKTFECIKDVRVVWELNRLQMLVQLGLAFKKTDDAKYVISFQYVLNDWCQHNPYLLGVNWLCPMEVGIRAINLIVAFDCFKDADIDDIFWQKYICLLYDHMHYLEHHWEYYDGRTNNHYLSNLVGYFYLIWFFQDLDGIAKKQNWVMKEILKECKKQVQPDGTSYEGSTTYHVLVTELLYLFYVLCDQIAYTLPQSFMQMLLKMFDFIDACIINNTDMITIGDNDSGKVLWCGLSQKVSNAFKSKAQKTELQYFEHFGLSIFKNKTWHISLRHHVYNNRQPSAHFHNDIGHVTLAINGVPILVDPGSYCYTASLKWRNLFRSVEQHNMPFVKDHEPVTFDERLFALALPECSFDRLTSSQGFAAHGRIHSGVDFNNQNILQASHKLYECFGLKLKRKIEVQKNVLYIKDFCDVSSLEIADLFLNYNFVFAAGISLQRKAGSWAIVHENKTICLLKSELELEQYETWVSNHYGQKTKTSALRATMKLADEMSHNVHSVIFYMDSN